MTSEELEKLKKWLTTLSSPDERAAVDDAFRAIASARFGPKGGGGGPMPPEIELDPELEQPESDDDDDGEGIDPDTEIEDPDDVLKGTSDDEDSADKDSDDISDKETEDGEKKPGEAGDGDDSDKADDGSDSTDTDGDKEAKESEEDELLDDTDSEVPSELKDDAETAAARKNEVFRRKVDATTGRKQIKRALSRIEQDKATVSEEDKKELEDLDKQLADIIQELKENPDSIDDMSAEEFNAIIRKVLDAVDKTGIRHTEITDMPSKVKKIKGELEDPLASDDLENEDNANRALDPEYQKMKAREAEKERLRKELEDAKSRAFNGDMESFKMDLKRAIGDQIQEMMEVEEETYAIVNRHHEDDDIAVPGIRIDDIPDEKKPTIDIYFDQSGSWGTSEVEAGMRAITDILQLEKEDLLTVNIYYFSKILSQDQAAARREGSQECWDLVIDNILAAPKTKNVIIMTDTDIGYDYGYAGHHGCKAGKGATVEGCVWYLWKHGYRVPEARLKLKGMKGTFEYAVKV